jgi:hypothetical protein
VKPAEEAGRRFVSIEDVVDALAAQCDGARKRDGRGFSRADAQEGGRLCAMKRRGIAWSAADAKKAMEIGGRYAKQAGDLLGDGRGAKAQGIEKSLRAGKVRCADEVVDKQDPYNYAGFSPGGKHVHFWRMAELGDEAGFRAALGDFLRMRHGVRRVEVVFSESAAMTVNGTKRRSKRSVVEFNGTTRDPILAIARRHGFVLEPAVETPVDEEIDLLRKSERAAWIHRGVRDGKKGAWAVFDLARKHEPFSAAVKKYLVDRDTGRRLWRCDVDDDWNWYVVWDERTFDMARRIAAHFQFAVCAEIAGPDDLS